MTRDTKIISRPDTTVSRKRNGDITFLNYKKPNRIVDNLYAIVYTFGCQGNERDGEVIKGILVDLGYQLTEDEDKADLFIINSCAIRHGAENRIIGELGRLKSFKDKKRDLKIGLGGCVSQIEVELDHLIKGFEHVDFFFGPNTITYLPEIITEVLRSNKRIVNVDSYSFSVFEELPSVRENKISAFVNIMYGCDKFCSYCIVPYTRGKERSRKSSDILIEINELVNLGYKEVTLVGQNVNAYGNDSSSEISFAELLSKVAETNIKRIRFITSHPFNLNDEIIKIIGKYDNIMPAIHLPVQSGSNRILKLMNRKYTKEEYLILINKLRAIKPGISITTDIIVAYPSEKLEDFIETLTLVDEVKFDSAFTFIYSRRPNTIADKSNEFIDYKEAHRRLELLIEKVNEKALNNNKRYINQVVEVLVRGRSKRNLMIYSGYNRENKLVNFTSDREIASGEIVLVLITNVKSFTLEGRLIDEEQVQAKAYRLQQEIINESYVRDYYYFKRKIEAEPILKGLVSAIATAKQSGIPSELDKASQLEKEFYANPMVVNFINAKNLTEDLIEEINTLLIK